ncbi:vegetative cell wall protein gp1-like [Phoenix dactylifera]|uniref:Vegetative cell wall protein gp1-like n=1 Tax=Phoenix dactylifera TaxID=42345 RepID=A0A8B7C1C6_PHODC|nr:vegetative cell wall protein gp1-like [Phoenix dactylifera]
MAAAQARELTPPPVIRKAGSYTVFLTPPATPKPSEAPRFPVSSPSPNPSSSPIKEAPLPPKAPPSYPPPVQAPPLSFGKPTARSSGSAFGFFWDTVAKVQDAHSSLDEYLANWLGLDQSKYQWALNYYYENKEVVKEGGKAGLAGKKQVV